MDRHPLSTPRPRLLACAVAALFCLLILSASAAAAGPKPVQIKPPVLKRATATVPYLAKLSAAGGTAPYTFSLQSGSPPEGIALSPSGELSGTPPSVGSSTFTVGVSDSSEPAKTATITYTLPVQLDVGPRSFGHATALGIVREHLTAAGGSGSYEFSLVSGAFPSYVALEGENGETAFGTPYETGSYEFTIQAKDKATGATGVHVYKLKVALGISPWSGPFPQGEVGKSYFATFNATGGSGDYSYEITEGKLPEGLELGRDETSAAILGTPSKAETQKIAVKAIDNKTGLTSKAKYTIAISAISFPKGADTLEERNSSGEFRGRDVVFLEESREKNGVARGTIWDNEGATGTWTYQIATGHLVMHWPGTTEGSIYEATCVAEECAGTQPFGTFTLTPFHF